MGAGLCAFLKAELKSGVDIVLDTLSFSERIKGADLVITGEGKIDGQTVSGKTPAGVAKRACGENIPVIAFAGSLGEGASLFMISAFPLSFRSCPASAPWRTLLPMEVQILRAVREM